METTKKRGRPRKNNIIRQDLLDTVPAVVEESIPTIPDIDRVNNLAQKESAMAEAGVTRLKTYRAINNLLTATKTVEEVVDGNVVKREIPDVAANAKGAELALKAFNDSKELQSAIGAVTHNKVVYVWKETVINNTTLPAKSTTRIVDVGKDS